MVYGNESRSDYERMHTRIFIRIRKLEDVEQSLTSIDVLIDDVYF